MLKFFGFFYNLRIRSKLLLIFTTTFVLSIAAGSTILYVLIRKTVESNIEKELRTANTNILEIVNTAANVSIRNHLRAVAEKNRDIAFHFYSQSKKGLISSTEAKDKTRKVMLSQTIGKTGYIFVWDISKAPHSIPLAVHPKIQGKDVAYVDFVQGGAALRNGYMEYIWKNPGEERERGKAMYLAYFEPWNWVICASSYKEEFTGLINIDDFSNQVLANRFGNTGYSFILNSKGDMIVHPQLTGNYFDDKDAKGMRFIKKICELKNGRITYWWRNPGEQGIFEKLAFFHYIPELDWIIASSGYVAEFYQPLEQIKKFALAALLISLMFVIPLISWISSHMTSRLKGLMKSFETGAAGDLTIRVESISKDEIGQLAKYFNFLMEKLDSYSASLKNEINDRTEAEKQLAIFKEFAENSGQGLLMTNLRGQITYINAALCIILDEGKPEKVLGKDVMTYYSRQEQQKLRDNILPAVFQHGQWLGEIPILSTKGRPASTIQNIFFIRDSAKNPLYVANIITDISEHERAEQAIRESEEKYRGVVEESLVGVYIIEEGLFKYVNKQYCDISGYTYDELVNKVYHLELVHPDDVGRVRDNTNERLRGETDSIAYQFRMIRKDGQEIMVKALGSVSINRGRPAIIGTLLDISNEQALEQQLRQAHKMEAIGQLAGGVAHDFNNILTALIGYGNLLKMKMKEDDPLRLYVDQMLASSEKAASLTQNLLAFSRKQMIKLEPFEVNSIIKDTKRLLKRLLTEDIELKLILSEEDLTILTDTTQLHQILLNLATNARDAMPQGGTLTIETREVELGKDFYFFHGKGGSGKYIRVSVSDTGHGMDDKTKEEIFNPFFTTKEVGKGTGLGLSIVYGIVKQHNGLIDVQSIPGRSTTFHLYFPAASPHTMDDKQIEPAFQVTPNGKEVILVAEDNTEVRQLTREVLEGSGYTVLEASDGRDAIEMFAQNKDRINLVILDVVMPKKNGNEAYNKIRKIREDVKALFTSGYTGDIVLGKGIQDNAFNFLPKPLSPYDLLKKVRLVLDN
jgi:PAS domain S-box-containing protein